MNVLVHSGCLTKGAGTLLTAFAHKHGHVRPSVRLYSYQVSSHWTDFREIWYWRLLWKSVEKLQILLKSERNVGDFTWRRWYACLYCWQQFEIFCGSTIHREHVVSFSWQHIEYFCVIDNGMWLNNTERTHFFRWLGKSCYTNAPHCFGMSMLLIKCSGLPRSAHFRAHFLFVCEREQGLCPVAKLKWLWSWPLVWRVEPYLQSCRMSKWCCI